MIFAVLGLGGMFFGMGYLITEGNASMLLSGYNTMNSEDQKSFPLKEYLLDFKRFHQWFGTGFTALGLLLYVINEHWLGYHLGVTPILAYLYFFWQTREYTLLQSKNTKNQFWIGFAVLLTTLVFVVGLLVWSDRKNTIVWTEQSIVIEGPYGIAIPFENIESIEILDELPEISSRLHGYSTGSVAKGKFKGAKGIPYHLLLDKPYGKILEINSTNENTVLLALEGVDEVVLAERLSVQLSNGINSQKNN